MRKILSLFTVIVSTYCFGQVPSDWQLSGIKGKVKTMTIDNTFTSGYKSRDVYNYNEEGYLTCILFCDNKKIKDEFSEDIKCRGSIDYSAFSRNNIRSVERSHFDNNYNRYKPKKHVEYWVNNNQMVSLYVTRFDSEERFEKMFYDDKYKLISEEYYYEDISAINTEVYTKKTDYMYDSKGYLVQISRHLNEDGNEETIHFINQVLETDNQGNIKKVLLKFDVDESLSEYTYEYY